MKRSKTVTLLIMGSLGLGAQGCGTDRADEGMYSFSSLRECVDSAIFSEEECRDLARDALASSPRFSSKEECEASFGPGACSGAPGAGQAGAEAGDVDVRADSGGYWMPMMMGFMAGRFLGGGRMYHGSQGLYREPGARPGDRSFRTAGGESVRPDRSGRVNNPSPRLSQSMTHNAKPSLGRSGFGARGGFAGGMGGGS
ncbi:MAG: DUF1190 domain-containing protein [Desulfovibrio sp.]|jgi:uncharacterized protein YgiB involved in biofilm formation|nr:DUF1190 domain-containing protein [Desulfovibrio sp.]